MLSTVKRFWVLLTRTCVENIELPERVRTRRSATANRSRVSIRGRPCRNFPHIYFDRHAKFGCCFSHCESACTTGPLFGGRWGPALLRRGVADRETWHKCVETYKGNGCCSIRYVKHVVDAFLLPLATFARRSSVLFAPTSPSSGVVVSRRLLLVRRSRNLRLHLYPPTTGTMVLLLLLLLQKYWL